MATWKLTGTKERKKKRRKKFSKPPISSQPHRQLAFLQGSCRQSPVIWRQAVHHRLANFERTEEGGKRALFRSRLPGMPWAEFGLGLLLVIGPQTFGTFGTFGTRTNRCRVPSALSPRLYCASCYQAKVPPPSRPQRREAAVHVDSSRP
ncbi:hypothetical protein LX32DRAFT_260999 [Colletotrichum zoysiae]|uniref:Uncharacterized protein n=1 Tax=Colletotrichum zoysiae TaxID=1216348 RepID=A0AAD9LTH8_9PEZI|nr:hypothetical protein LX32DRAFT_260999 [Colletotrichum zoysiae]